MTRGPALLIWDCASCHLHVALLTALERAARAYHARTDLPVRVTSGWRSLQQQAELMSRMSRRQLLQLYGRNGMPDYLNTILARLDRQPPPAPSELYDILCKRQEGYVSAHLCGAAVDLASEAADTTALRTLLEREGFAVLDERDAGIPCLHARLTALELTVVRE